MNALIIANGTLPSKQLVRQLVASTDIIICADGGANHARNLHITPDVILGDLDSITASTKKYFRHIPTLFIGDQNSADLEKAIELCLRLFITHADIIGATGTRVDHTTGSLGCFKKYGAKIDLTIIDTTATISLVKKHVHLKTRSGEKISLIPLDRCMGVTTAGLRYSLRDEALELGVREGISNEATGKNVVISVKKGSLLVYRFHKLQNNVI